MKGEEGHMPDYIGLYYPRIAFPSDAWVKLAALYWDKLGRIVPPDYVHDDSNVIQQLQGELGLIEDFAPSRSDTYNVGRMFDDLLRSKGDRLVKYYSVLSHNSDLLNIYCGEKIAHSLTHTLLDMGLAVRWKKNGSANDFEQIWMHPKLAFIYIEALAAYMASTRNLQPVTDNVRDHVVMGEYTLERLAQALLEADDGQPHLAGNTPTAQEVERQMAAIAFQSIFLQDIASVPVKKIIQLRQKHRIELTTFQTHIHELVTQLDTIQQIDDSRALKAHLEVAYQRELKPQLDDLKKCMKSLAIETVPGVLNIKVALPPLLATAGTALHLAPVSPEIAGVTAIACSIFPIFQQKRTEVREKVQKSPVAYLLYAQEGLTPMNLVSQVAQTTRHMLFGV